MTHAHTIAAIALYVTIAIPVIVAAWTGAGGGESARGET